MKYSFAPLILQGMYQLIVSALLAFLAYTIRHSDPATFQFIVGALVSLVTGQAIHLGRQTSTMIDNGSGSSSSN